MSTLVAQEKTSSGGIPIYQRVTEIMKEKGGYYSRQAMAKRLGISRETLRHMLAGKREIYWFELEKIARDLKVPLHRITLEDVHQDYESLHRLLATLEDNQSAIELAEKLVEVALGYTERCDALTLLGRALFEVKEYDKAHECRLAAYSLAEKIYEKYDDEERLHETLKFLLTSFTIRKDYTSAIEVVKKVEGVFQTDPSRYAALCYTLAMMAYDSGSMVLAREKLIESLECYRRTDNQKEIGRAEHCVAFIEYKLGNLPDAKLMFEKAIDTLDPYQEAKLTAVKDFIKVLIKMDDHELASEYITRSLQEMAVTKPMNTLTIKFQLLSSMCQNDPAPALSILEVDEADNEFKFLASKILLAHYSKVDDAHSVLKYYKMMERFALNRSDVLGEGDL